ncbi:peptide chain release factor 3 [Solicola sp. PLA-1-18]|uniref:peptide chain release factor 3 n=1 Tax=Solicola sp. PLA-1-18 TaxID=3380532 RepID=UPI003B7E2B9F
MSTRVPEESSTAGEGVREAARRRTFAVISHPDAGKSTLTEALALHAQVITQAGATHGKGGRRATVSDWMEMEQQRGISIASTALQFDYDEVVLNLLDTPGHADFSEDTYRVLSAVDCAVMLLDAAKGLEPQTLKLFQVCRRRRLPIITVVNKWDRPGLDPLELIDQIQERIGIRPTPLTWPVGVAGDFRGVLDADTGEMTAYERTAGGATRAPETQLSADEALAQHPVDFATAQETLALVREDGGVHDQETFLSGDTSPTVFASAALNFGVSHLLGVLERLGPAPAGADDVDGHHRDVGSPFSALVFKMQAGLDKAHRDHVAYARVCSGVFERGMSVTDARTGRKVTTKYVHTMFGRERRSADVAYPGDVIGLVNASELTIGDTVYAGPAVRYPPIPRFDPEHFRVARGVDASRYKQLHRGLAQLDREGVVQVLRSPIHGEQAPVLAAVGPMQFDVAIERMDSEFGAAIRTEPLSHGVSRTLPDDDAVKLLQGSIGVEIAYRLDGSPIALFADRWRLQKVDRDHPELGLLDGP